MTFFFFFSLCFFLFFFYITLYIWNPKLYSRFLIYGFWFLLSILYLYFLYNFCDFVFVWGFFLSFFFFFFFLTLYFLNSKLYSRLLTFAFLYLLSMLYLYFIYNFCDFVFVCLFVFSFFSFFYSLTLYFWNSKLYSRFFILAFWYMLSILYL